MHTTIMENQMEKNIEHEMDTRVIYGIIGINTSQIITGHGFLRFYIRECTRLQEGPLCPLLRVS